VNAWLIVIAAGLLTYAVRAVLLLAVEPDALPAGVRRSLRFVSPAVLTAIIVPAVLYAGEGGAFDASPGNERLLAASVAVLIARLTSNTWLTIGAGMASLWLLEAAG
jgi:branched-subunit amino acid transport protein